MREALNQGVELQGTSGHRSQLFCDRVAILEGRGKAQVDQEIASKAGLTKSETDEAVGRLKLIDNQAIAAAVAAPPTEWGVPVDERLVLAKYLARRRDELLALLPLPPPPKETL